MTLRVRLDRSGVAAGQTTARYALVALQAPPAAQPPAGGRRLRAGPIGVDGRPEDHPGASRGERRPAAAPRGRPLRLVVYDDQVDVVFGSTLASREARTAATRLREIDARGSTDLAGGWLRGANEDAVITKRST